MQILPPYRRLHFAVNQYSWHVYYQRENRSLSEELHHALGQVAACDTDGFEPNMENPADAARYSHFLTQHGLSMRSIYVNSTLHDRDEADRSIELITAIAESAQPFGTRLVVTNPNPIRWDEPIDKTDEQLETQAKALNTLGEWLTEIGMKLAYHNHDAEMRCAGREFHHMMLATDPKNVSLCLDPHWIYRGAGNSSVALFDIVRLYGSRISEIHLRQSRDGVWSETFDDGDIDYRSLANLLADMDVRPHLVLEQATEWGSPYTMDMLEAQSRSIAYARDVFSR